MSCERSHSIEPGITKLGAGGAASMYIKLMQSAIRVQQRVITSFERNHYFPKEAKRIRLADNPTAVLDVGSGKGYFGDSLIAAMPDSTIISTDINSDHQGMTPFVKASGDALPFPDKSFDISTIYYVLHHFDKPELALREAKRVSKKIIIQEDTYKNGWQKKWYELHVRSYQLNSPESGATVRTDEEWQKLFAAEGLEIIKKRRIRKVGYPVTRYEYQLTPTRLFTRGI